MQDIQDAEADSVRDLTQFVDAELDYHERCAAELRRLRDNWPARSSTAPSSQSNTRSHSPVTDRRPTVRARSSTAVSYTESLSRINTTGSEPAPPVRMPSVIRPGVTRAQTLHHSQSPTAADPVRPTIGRPSASFQGGATLDRERGRITSSSGSATPTQPPITNVGALRGQLRPVSRIVTSPPPRDVFADGDEDTASDEGDSPGWGRGSASSATSVGSLTRSTSNGVYGTGSGGGGYGGGAVKKAPPPPPPSRAKKPPPPVPVRREVGY